ANEIIENSTIVVFEWAIGEGIPCKFVSKNISIFGYTEEDFYSGRLDYWDFVYEEDRERTQNTVWNARKEEITQFKHTYRVICKDGSIRWVEEWTLLERNPDGVQVSEKGVLRDITEQVETAAKLQQSETRYRELFENASAAIYTFDLDGNFTSVNNACCRITGYGRNELMSGKITDLLEPKTRAKVKRLKLLNVIQKYLDKNLELEIICKNGRTVILECRNVLIYKDEQPIEVQTVAQDVTFRKLAEEKIFRLSYQYKLTGLHNRAYFEEALKSLDERKEYPFSIIIGDMNGLKLANDAFGHKEGDNLLVTTARIMEKACRKNDIISRLGGDEFAIILPGTTRQEAGNICERIKQLCTNSHYKPLQPSVALGCAEKLSDKQTLEEFNKAADEDMYKNKLNENKIINHSIISTLQTALEEKMFETKEHSERLRGLALELGSAAGLSESKLDELSLAAVMHDIGKIALPGETLLKADTLTDKDWEIIKKHPEIGYHIILASLKMASIAEYILAHHEHWDGGGYPRNLRGEEIPIVSRIISIVDAFDVMQHSRPYKKAMSREEALTELQRCAGTQFDPDLVGLFIRIISK
ncbi:MAG: HD domain-containing phosphohydrolase, partial [Pseudomonadota bacterium]